MKYQIKNKTIVWGIMLIMVCSLAEYLYRNRDQTPQTTEDMINIAIRLEDSMGQAEQIVDRKIAEKSTLVSNIGVRITENTRWYLVPAVLDQTSMELQNLKWLEKNAVLIECDDKCYGMNFTGFQHWLSDNSADKITIVFSNSSIGSNHSMNVPNHFDYTELSELTWNCVEPIYYSSNYIVFSEKINNDYSTKSEINTGLDYLLQKVGDKIIVYQNGENRILFESDLNLELLPNDLIEQLEAGLYLQDDEALYNFLESYSS